MKLVDYNNDQLSVREQSELLDINRSTLYYNKREDKTKKDMDLEIMIQIDMQFLLTPFYGTRRMTAYLCRIGYIVNRKRVRRLMRIMLLIPIYPKPNLSKRNHDHKVYPYLLRNLDIVRPNQVWCADITYIPTEHGHVYLFAVMDWYSRRILSWKLSTTLDTDFCIEALDAAIKQFGIPDIFNTDQGCQFTSNNFTSNLKGHGIKISMDSKGRALDNVVIERFWRNIKQEKIYLNEYDSISALRGGIEEYMLFYNEERPHQSFAYSTPDEIYKQKIGNIKTPQLAIKGAIAA